MPLFSVIAALALFGAVAATGQTAKRAGPKVVVQFGHVDEVDAAGWLGDTNFLITAESSDSSIIFWDANDGEVVDHIRFPRIDAAGDMVLQSILSIVVDPDDIHAVITTSASGKDGDDLEAERRVIFNLNVDTREITLAGKPTPLPAGTIDKETPPILPVASDGSRLVRIHNGLSIERTGKPSVNLTGVARGWFYDANLSPDGNQLLQLAIINQKNPVRRFASVKIWDFANGTALPHFEATPDYKRVRWIGDRRYAVSGPVLAVAEDDAPPTTNLIGSPNFDPKAPAQVAPVPTLVVDAATGKQIGTVPARCMAIPVGDEGLFVAAGPGACASPAQPDALWFFDRIDPTSTGFTMARQWRRRGETLSGGIITALTASPDGTQMVAAYRRLQPVKGVYPPFLQIYYADPAKQYDLMDTATNIEDFEDTSEADSRIQSIGFSVDNKYMLFHIGSGGAISLRVADGQLVAYETNTDNPEVVISDGKKLMVAGVGYDDLLRYDLDTGNAILPAIQLPNAKTGGVIVGKPIFWTASTDAAIRYFDARTGEKIISIFSFPGGKFFAASPDGRYDTNLAPDTPWVKWLMPDSTFEPLGLQTYMRDYFEPGLVARKVDCISQGNCDVVFKPVRDLAKLNRVLPEVKITGVEKGPTADSVYVVVNATQGVDLEAVNGVTKSGVYDLRLYRDKQLIGQNPVPKEVERVEDDLARVWRPATEVAGTAGGATVTRRFLAYLPSYNPAKPVWFSAYAFNSDRVKGATTYWKYTPPVPVPPRERLAFVITIGVNAYSIPGKSLRFAVNDADAIAAAFTNLPGYRVVTIPIVSETGYDAATKANIKAVLALLAGDEGDGGVGDATKEGANRKLLEAAGIDTSGFDYATPDDLLILSFSGHGYADPRGNFYLLPSDARQPDTAAPPILSSMISTAELTAWMRGVDAGEMAMIIDACHSAASVATGGFKPGPMGDPGLGQLAFDKGIRILAATQADDVALEDRRLGQGLLTYAIVKDGLGTPTRPGAADRSANGGVALNVLLNYGVARLPGLAEELARDSKNNQTAREFMPMIVPRKALAAPPPARLQKPSLFDFTETTSPATLIPVEVGE